MDPMDKFWIADCHLLYEIKCSVLSECEALQAGGWCGAGPEEQKVYPCWSGCFSVRHVLPGYHTEWRKIQSQVLYC